MSTIGGGGACDADCAAVDLHSNNGVLTIIDDRSDPQQRRLANKLELFIAELEPFRSTLHGVAVESTFNGYWLVDGLQAEQFPVALVNTGAIQQYEGLKRSDDQYDAWWLAHMMRLGILTKGHIYPRADRAVRDLMRKRASLVQNRSRGQTFVPRFPPSGTDPDLILFGNGAPASRAGRLGGILPALAILQVRHAVDAGSVSRLTGRQHAGAPRR